MKASATTCPSCSSDRLSGFYAVDDVPVNSCLLLEDAVDARRFPRGRLDLALCHGCGFITNRAFDAGQAEYSARYEETQGCSPTFVEFGRRLAADWVAAYDLAGKHVLEIGCGKGEFLGWMIEAGAGSGTGIDPGVHVERIPPQVAAVTDWIADRYDERYAHLEADAVVCRHTLEHIAPVRDFLTTLRAHIGARDVPVLFELPDTRRVLGEAAFWDLYYEHCSYFTADSLARLFHATGFEVLRVELAYDGQYLLLEARPTELTSDRRRPPVPDDDIDRIIEEVRGFREAIDDLVTMWRRRLATAREAAQKVVLWGGGSKAVAFITTLGLGEEISGVVDINPRKQDRYLAGSGHAVIAPETLCSLRPDLVVVMNPVYVGEIESHLERLGLSPEVLAV
jgi:SAM-dependent methyltransferase